MSTFYQYESPTELIQDLVDNKKIFFEKGLVANVTVSAKQSNEDGFIMIYAYNYNSMFQNVNRYSYTLTQFRQLTFSQESLGLYYYTTIDPINNISTNWTQNHLNAGEKSEYMNAAYNMLRKNFVARWLLEWNLQPTPAPIINVTNLSGIQIPNNSTFITSDTITGETNQIRFVVKNLGTSRMDISGTNAEIITGVPGETVSVNNVVDSLSPVVDEVELIVDFSLLTLGAEREILVTILSNDPNDATFSFFIVTNVSAVPTPDLNGVDFFNPSGNVFLFPDSIDADLQLSNNYEIQLENTGNASTEITNVVTSELEITSGINSYTITEIATYQAIVGVNEKISIVIEYTVDTLNPQFVDFWDDWKLNNPGVPYKLDTSVTITTTERTIILPVKLFIIS